MRVLPGLGFCIAAFVSGASAQDDPNWNFPNPFREELLAGNCANFQAMMQQADPSAMQALAGFWGGTSMIPGTPGIMPDTPIQFRVQNDAGGNFQVERYGCFAMESVAGMPSLGQSCSTSMLYGQFAARWADQSTVVVATMTRGTHFTGAPIPPNCGIAYYQFLDANTLVDQAGNRQGRIQN
ncbi:MAG: hypothetical protein ACKVPY_02490 [Paracoccaceae bacterium]